MTNIHKNLKIVGVKLTDKIGRTLTLHTLSYTLSYNHFIEL